jgi:hypothetical protein
MTTKYIVTCYSPPTSLDIKSGQTVEVEGWKTGNNVRAKSIINITKKGPKCHCGSVPKALFAENITVKGKVSNVQQLSDPVGVQFDLET